MMWCFTHQHWASSTHKPSCCWHHSRALFPKGVFGDRNHTSLLQHDHNPQLKAKLLCEVFLECFHTSGRLENTFENRGRRGEIASNPGQNNSSLKNHRRTLLRTPPRSRSHLRLARSVCEANSPASSSAAGLMKCFSPQQAAVAAPRRWEML